MLLDQIKNLSEKYFDETQKHRHHIHANPELSFHEYETSKYIQEQLTAMGIPFEVKANTGIVALVHGKNADKKTVALRADIDALPIQETNDVSYKSKGEVILYNEYSPKPQLIQSHTYLSDINGKTYFDKTG